MSPGRALLCVLQKLSFAMICMGEAAVFCMGHPQPVVWGKMLSFARICVGEAAVICMGMCVQSWRSRRRRRHRSAMLSRPAAQRLRNTLVLKVENQASDRDEVLWRRVFGAIDSEGSGLCDMEEWTLAMRQLVPVEDASTSELRIGAGMEGGVPQRLQKPCPLPSQRTRA